MHPTASLPFSEGSVRQAASRTLVYPELHFFRKPCHPTLAESNPPRELPCRLQARDVREAKVLASAAFVRLGSFDSKRPKLGEITVECKGAQAPACRITSSVTGPLRLKNAGAVTQNPSAPAAASAAKGKGKNRTPGGVGGGGGGGGGNTGSTTASSSPPDASTPPAAPPNTGSFDIDVDWNPCFFDDSLCFHISYDMGGDGVVAGPDGSGDTVDGLPGDINIGRGSPRL